MGAKHAFTAAFIGIDGSGKSTLTANVESSLKNEGVHVSHVKIRSGRSGLDRQAVEMGYAGLDGFVGADSAMLMLAALTWSAVRDTKPARRMEGSVLLYDRYTYCMLALARAQAPAVEPKLRELFSSLSKPDLTFFVAVDPDVAITRLETRGGTTQGPAFLAGFDAAYRTLPEAADYILIDGNKTQEAMLKQVLSHFPKSPNPANLLQKS